MRTVDMSKFTWGPYRILNKFVKMHIITMICHVVWVIMISLVYTPKDYPPHKVFSFANIMLAVVGMSIDQSLYFLYNLLSHRNHVSTEDRLTRQDLNNLTEAHMTVMVKRARYFCAAFHIAAAFFANPTVLFVSMVVKLGAWFMTIFSKYTQPGPSIGIEGGLGLATMMLMMMSGMSGGDDDVATVTISTDRVWVGICLGLVQGFLIGYLYSHKDRRSWLSSVEMLENEDSLYPRDDKEIDVIFRVLAVVVQWIVMTYHRDSDNTHMKIEVSV